MIAKHLFNNSIGCRYCHPKTLFQDIPYLLYILEKNTSR